MKKTAFISDVLFTFIGTGVCTLCLFRYLQIDLPSAYALSSLCGILAAIAAFCLLKSKRNAFRFKKTEEKRKEAFLLHLALLSDKQKTDYFLSLFAREENVARLGTLRFYSDQNLYQIHYAFSPLSEEKVAAFARFKTNKRKILLFRTAQSEAVSLASRLGIDLYTPDDVYARALREDCFPKDYSTTETKAIKTTRAFSHRFTKHSGKRFLLSGVFLLGLSFLTPFSYYYLCIGGILLLCAVLLRIFGKESIDR